ncbi:MAG: ligase-associated DNA damage response endonuclease PdeM [Cyanobacteria bacterium P01_A01_bin.114]
MTSHTIQVEGHTLDLLSDKAIYLPASQSLLMADVHLGKAETFQSFGIPIANQVNDETLQRLQRLCQQWEPQQLFILGDLFHTYESLTSEVLSAWTNFLTTAKAKTTLIVGNHDRRLVSALNKVPMHCQVEAMHFGSLLLSHEPVADHTASLNLCGHVHPVVRLQSKLDSLRLPCFYLDALQKQLTLPSFGAFTGGYEVSLQTGAVAYIALDEEVIPIEASS